MKIKVLESNGCLVRFSCSCGIGVGYCFEETLREGMLCDVEVDINLVLQIGVNTIKSSENGLFITAKEGVNLLNGIVESIDEDDIICLRLANDCILMLVYNGEGINVNDILLIRAKEEDLELTVTGI